MIKINLKIYLTLLFAATLAMFSCNNDDDMNPNPGGDDVIASFQFVVSNSNFLEVVFTNFSQNATSYAWDFGDGNTSTEESPTYAYSGGGTFTVKLTATGANGSADRTETVTITDPDSNLALLAGSTSKTWYLQRDGVAMGIGPSINDNQWWAFGLNTPLGDRPCILDDSYTFHRDGTWEINTNNTVWIDLEGNGGWLGPMGAEACYDEAGNLTSSIGEDLSALGNGGSYTYEFDQTANTITISGEGAYIGLPNKTSGGDNYLPQPTKTYTMIHNIADGEIADSLQMAIVADDGSFSWNFYLVSYDNPADLPEIPGSMPVANFSLVKDGTTVTLTNSSTNSTNYSWDFGDGNMSSDENPVHTYAAEGEYTITLTAMDDMGGSDMKSEIVVISSATFTAAALSSATGKSWKLDGAASYFVGSGIGLGDFWPGIDENGVVERACQLDDEFIFFDDGTLEYVTQGQVWAEGYMGGTNACINDADIPSPYDVFGSGTHMFTSTDTQITAIGTGAFVGFNKAFNGGELDGTNAPAAQITYEVFDYTAAGNVERVSIAIDYGGGFWNMRLISEN